MQGIHCTSDAPFVLARLGPKRAEEGAYVWQKLMKRAPCRQRHRRAGRGHQSDSVLLRLRRGKLKDGSRLLPRSADVPRWRRCGPTPSTRRTRRSKRNQGIADAGKLADITVLSKDIMTVPEDQIPSTTCLHDRRRQGAVHRFMTCREGRSRSPRVGGIERARSPAQARRELSRGRNIRPAPKQTGRVRSFASTRPFPSAFRRRARVVTHAIPSPPTRTDRIQYHGTSFPSAGIRRKPGALRRIVQQRAAV